MKLHRFAVRFAQDQRHQSARRFRCQQAAGIFETNALDIELANALTGQKSAEQAIMDASAEWDSITDRLGVENQAASIAATRGVWPTATICG